MAVKLFHVGVKGLVRDEQGRILLLKVNLAKLNGSVEAYWDIPGGRIEDGQTVYETLARELKEEIDVDYKGEAEFFTAVVANINIPTDRGEFGLILMIYTIEIPKDCKIIISDEHIAYEWVSPEIASARLAHKYPKEFMVAIKKT